MYCHPSSTGGPTVWDFAATPGAASKFIAKDSPSGKAARELFKHGMKCLFQNEKASDTETSSDVTTETTPVNAMEPSENISQTYTSDDMVTYNQVENKTNPNKDLTERLALAPTPDQCPPTSSNSNLIAGEIKWKCTDSICWDHAKFMCCVVKILQHYTMPLIQACGKIIQIERRVENEHLRCKPQGSPGICSTRKCFYVQLSKSHIYL